VEAGQCARLFLTLRRSIATRSPNRAVDVKLLRSIPLLDHAAIDAVRQWRFTPTLLNGRPVPVIMTVTVHST
jgi:protein TonB